jgi:hypothetical protein
VIERQTKERVGKMSYEKPFSVNGEEISHDEAKEAFSLVQNEGNWKNPIDKVICCDDRLLGIIERSIVFFTGSEPKVISQGKGIYRIVADGYYIAIGA